MERVIEPVGLTERFGDTIAVDALFFAQLLPQLIPGPSRSASRVVHGGAAGRQSSSSADSIRRRSSAPKRAAGAPSTML